MARKKSRGTKIGGTPRKRRATAAKATEQSTNAKAAAGSAVASVGNRTATERIWLTKPSRARVGREVVALRDQIARDRAQRYADYLKWVKNPTEPPVVALRAAGVQTFRAVAPAAARQPLRILAEGDSWFDYPLPPVRGDGVIYQLQKLLGYPINNMAHWGEEVRQMLGLAQRQEIVTRLTDNSVNYDAMLFSGGGNDLVGDQLVTFLQDQGPVPPPAKMFNDDAMNAVIDLLKAEYKELVGIRNQYSAGTVIFVNSYDFPKVTGQGVCGIGPWLKPSLDYVYGQMGVAVPDPEQEYQVVKTMLERFNQMLQDIAKDPSITNFIVVGTQDTLDRDKDWQNEIHPKSSGFAKIAAKFQAALSKQFP